MNIGALAFTWPAALALLPVATAFLVYVYQKRRPPEGRGVGTLFLLKKLPTRTPRHSGFLPPLQFWIDLLVLALLIIALAGPYRRESSHRIALVIDNSLSMATTPVPGGPALLERAIDAARHTLLSAPSSYEIDVFLVAPTIKSLSLAPLRPKEATALLDSIAISFASDALPQLVERFLQDSEIDGVWVYSDQDLILPVDTPEVSKKLTSVNVRGEVSKGDYPNLSLSRLEDAEANGASLIRAVVSNFSSRPARVRVELRVANSSEVYQETPLKALLEIAPGQEKETTFKVPSDWSYGRAELFNDKNDKQASWDVIPQDNQAWVTRRLPSSTIRFVGPISPTDLKIEGLLGLHFTWDSGNALAEKFGPTAPTLYHRMPLPQDRLTGPTLIVYPTESDIPAVAKVTSSTNNPVITRWLDSHPLTSYINLQTLVIPQARIIEPLQMGLSVVATDKGTVLASADLPEGRVAISGLELFPYSGVETPALSILTLNLLKWVFTLSNSHSLRPYELPKAPNGEKVYSFVDSFPGAQKSMIAISDPPQRLGVVKIGTEYASIQFSDGHELDVRKSRSTSLSAAASPKTAGLSKPSQDSLVTLLALSLLGLLGLDVLGRIIGLTWRRRRDGN